MDQILTLNGKRHIALGTATTLRILPRSYPFVMLDRVRACDAEDGTAFSIKNITMTDPVLSGHFPGYPIYPGVLVIEAMVQNSGLTLTVRDLYRQFGCYEALLDHLAQDPATVPPLAKVYCLAESRVKHTRALYPGDTLDLEARLTLERGEMLVFKVAATVQGQEVARGQIAMANAIGRAAPMAELAA